MFYFVTCWNFENKPSLKQKKYCILFLSFFEDDHQTVRAASIVTDYKNIKEILHALSFVLRRQSPNCKGYFDSNICKIIK